MSKSKFIEDIKEIDEKLNFSIENYTLNEGPLVAAFVPYYVHPTSLELMVVLKREIHAGSFVRTNRKMGISTLEVELPIDKPLTIEEAFNLLDLPANIQNSTPFGSVMTDPKNSTKAIEMVAVQIDPPAFLDASRGIIKQEPGKFEIGAIGFDSLLGAIQENFIQDITTRMILSELYIMAIEEAKKQEQNNDFSGGHAGDIIGGGNNHPSSFYEKAEQTEKSTPKTSGVADDVLQQNQQKDFGAIYSKK